MSKVYDLIFISNIPAFYKIRLYNRIAEKKRILVVFLREGNPDRNKDFYAEERKFEWVTLPPGTQRTQALACIKLLRGLDYNELVIGGWDELPFWAAAFSSPKRKNAVVVESSYLESKTAGIKAWLKRIFLSRIAKAYCSGKSNVKLVDLLGFRRRVVITKGVGLYRRVTQPAFEVRSRVEKFLYVGRLSPEKNLAFLIEQFRKFPDLTLNIVGFGPQESELKALAGDNIVFHGAVVNTELPTLYRKNDVFVLPSKSEPWGMVVEEALNNGVPVLVSNHVGCAEEIVVDGENGVVFEWNSEASFANAISRLQDVNFYNILRTNIAKRNPAVIEQHQVDCY